MFGYTGKILHVDLTNRKLEIEEPEEAFYRKYLGGSALGLYYILRDMPAGADPLGPDNVLTFANGPLTGTPISGQSRMSVNARSPLIGQIGDAQMGGFFPAEMKFAGLDAIILKGKADTPVYLLVNEGVPELRDASHLWGLDTGTVEDTLKDELGDDQIEVAQCGPGGERLIRYAAVINMKNRAAGRTGMGAVMGSKNLKAIVVRGKDKKSVKISNPDSYKELMRSGTKGVRTNLGMLGLQKYGTAATLERNNAAGGLPTRSWDSGYFDGYEAVSGERMHDTILLKNDTCYACAVRCKRVVEKESIGLKPEYGGPEYESQATFTSYCGVADMDASALANQLCNQYGIDTITAGASIAFAMDCFEKGIINGTMTDGVELVFGDPDAMLWALDKIINREGIGKVLGDGTEAAAKEWGNGADQLITTVKGSNMPAHMPQVKRSLGLIYAVNPFGADHQSSNHDPSYAPGSGAEDKRRLGLLGLHDQLEATDLSEGKVKFAWETQKYYSVLDSASVCQFVWGPSWQLYGPDHLLQAINDVCGWDMTMEELQEAGARRIVLMRQINAREGIGRNEDKLPPKMFKPLQGGPSDGVRMTPEELATAMDQYYAMAGCDTETGMPTNTTLRELELDFAIAD